LTTAYQLQMVLYSASNEVVENVRRFGKDGRRNGRGLFQGTTPTFVWKDWGT